MKPCGNIFFLWLGGSASVLLSELRWFEVSLGKILYWRNSKLLLMCWSTPCTAATTISVCMNNCKSLWIKILCLLNLNVSFLFKGPSSAQLANLIVTVRVYQGIVFFYFSLYICLITSQNVVFLHLKENFGRFLTHIPVDRRKITRTFSTIFTE